MRQILALLMSVAVALPQARIPGPGGAAASAGPPFTYGFNFRNTLAYVTDGANYVWANNVAGATWPHTYTIGAASVVAGYNQNIGTCTNTPSGTNDSTSGDVRLSGTQYASSVQDVCFYITLPNGSGTYNVNFGVRGGLNQSTISILDGYGTITGLAAGTTNTITWVSGSNAGFTPDMVGRTITFNSIVYTISARSGNALTVTPDPGVVASASWSYTCGAGTAVTSGTFTNVAIASGSVLDAGGNVTSFATWTAAGTNGGATLSAAFTANVLVVRWGLAAGGNPYSALANVTVSQ